MAKFKVTLENRNKALNAAFEEVAEDFGTKFGEIQEREAVMKDHAKLTNRDAVDQHPIGAITNLRGELGVRPSDGISNSDILTIMQT